ncbi:MAG: YeeE/YedE thiosulfate transporter family protein [Acidimicrobiales bacterium]|nr:YeeE/YedE thiosulfate transporter family protein [Acidimicrobiales bacterium]
MTSLIITGAVAGLALGYVLQRSDLCFHSAWRGVLEGRFHLFKIWILGVALASVGLSALYSSGWWELNEGLSFRPQGNLLGGALIGLGMVIAASCTSGLFYKLGSGMLGAAVGLVAWFFGDAGASRFLIGRDGSLDLRGSVMDLDGPTIPDVVGIDRAVVSVVFVVVVVALLARSRRGTREGVQWSWAVGGLALGVATIGAWVLAGAGGASFGPSTVGGPASLVDGGGVNVWLVSFLVALVPGALFAAVRAKTLWVRGERSVRYGQLAVGGALLGVGGQIGGGCNLGHGLSGAAQLNVSSWVTVGAIACTIAVAAAVQRRLGLLDLPSDWRINATTD